MKLIPHCVIATFFAAEYANSFFGRTARFVVCRSNPSVCWIHVFSSKLIHTPKILVKNAGEKYQILIDPQHLRPKGGERKLRFIWAWKHDGILMGVGYAEYRLPRDLAGFEPVTICFQDRPKMHRGRGGSSEKSVCWTQTCLSLLKQE